MWLWHLDQDSLTAVRELNTGRGQLQNLASRFSTVQTSCAPAWLRCSGYASARSCGPSALVWQLSVPACSSLAWPPHPLGCSCCLGC